MRRSGRRRRRCGDAERARRVWRNGVRCVGAMGARDARTHGASIAVLSRRRRTPQRGRTARPRGTTLFRQTLLTELVEPAVERGRVELAVAVLAERGQLVDLAVDTDCAGLALRARREAPHRAGA